MVDGSANDRLVLVVEDDPDAQRVAESMLHMLGFRTRLAPNGREALRLLEKLDPAAILLDLHMPELDGLAFLDTARREVEGFDRIRVIATSGVYRNQTSISRPLRRRGVEHFVGKPFSLARLKEAMTRAFDDEPAIEAAPSPAEELQASPEPVAANPGPRGSFVRPPSSGPKEDLSVPRRARRRGPLTGENARVVLPRASGSFSRPGGVAPSGSFSRPGSKAPSGKTGRSRPADLSRPGAARPSGPTDRTPLRPVREKTRSPQPPARTAAPPRAKPAPPPPPARTSPPPRPAPPAPPTEPAPATAQLSRPGARIPDVPPFDHEPASAVRPRAAAVDSPTLDWNEPANRGAQAPPSPPSPPDLGEAPRVRVTAKGELSTTSGAGGPDAPEVGSEHGNEERFACYYGAAIFFRRAVESAAITEVSAGGLRLLANKTRLKVGDEVELRAHVDMPSKADGLLDLRIEGEVVWVSSEGGKSHLGVGLVRVDPMEGFARLLASLQRMKDRKRSRR